ncbi:hypothetical protein KAR91_06060 [Candidatus Pacearchaeota archaeon]|nr:hypothetical protein [Candidatus Pacearchaeota archaeon]
MKLLQDKDGNTSSKRVAGFVISSCGLVLLLIVGFMSIKTKVVDPDTAMESGKTLLIVGCGLLGVGVVEFLGKK